MFWAFSHIFHCKRQSVLYAVDAFMLRAVIHKCALNIRGQRYNCYIPQKYCQSDNALYERYEHLWAYHLFKKPWKEIRQCKKQRECYDNWQYHCTSKHGIFLFLFFGRPFFLFFRCEFFFLFLWSQGTFIILVLEKWRWIHQCAHAQIKRIDKAHHTS